MEIPTALGPWITVLLSADSVTSASDGMISFTVNQLNPAGGTWHRAGPSGNSNGGWIQVLPGR
jgi:hypothetical protein